MSKIINDISGENKELAVIYINGEKLIQVVFYGENRDSEITEWHKKVMQHWGRPVNYVYFPFESGYQHGQGIDWFINQTYDYTDNYIFWDMDCIPLRKDYLEIAYDKIKDGETLYGQIQQSNHLKNIMDTDCNHPYIGACGMFLSKKLYEKLGKPSFTSDNKHWDTAELLTYKCEELGYTVAGIWPKKCEGMTDDECIKVDTEIQYKKSKVGCFKFGMGTTYGNSQYHAMCQNVPRSKELFINKCKEILNE